MDIVSKPSDITRLDQTAQSLVEWSLVPLGSILRTHAYSYPNWGIQITPKNIEWIITMSKSAYYDEWTETDASMNDLIARACRAANMLDANTLLNTRIGLYGAEVLQALALENPSKLFEVVDIGAGPGGSSAALLDQLRKRGVSNVHLTILDPSNKRLDSAMERLGQYVDVCRVDRCIGTVADIDRFHRHSADLIITNAAIHHESFNTHLPAILRVLKQGAKLVSGDWHEGTYESPARSYWVYYVLQHPFEDHSDIYAFIKEGKNLRKFHERNELKDFRLLFQLSKDDVLSAFTNLTPNERAACAGGIRYWHEMGKHLALEGRKRMSPEVLIQCHERVAKRLEALRNAGFTFDREDLSKYRELLKRRGYGELTAVMVARRSLTR
ncbi:MAG: methyltransferase domain-containing protein [Candidatus Micrarchaeota archaeon]